MNKFLLLACIVKFVEARPDVGLGYHYNPSYNTGPSLLRAPLLSSYGSPALTNQNYFEGIHGGNINPEYFLSNAHYTQGLSGTSTGSNKYTDQYQQEQFDSPIVTKQIYVHNAPEDHNEQQLVRHINIGRPRKNYRVLFINTASSSSSKAKIIANVAPVEDKTIIYVLSKKLSDSDITTEVKTPTTPEHNKPEVVFIKYKNPEEAIRTQHSIQDYYDSLNGSSQVGNEGVIPVSSTIENSERVVETEIGQRQNVVSDVGADHNVIQSYLPPN